MDVVDLVMYEQQYGGTVFKTITNGRLSHNRR